MATDYTASWICSIHRYDELRGQRDKSSPTSCMHWSQWSQRAWQRSMVAWISRHTSHSVPIPVA